MGGTLLREDLDSVVEKVAEQTWRGGVRVTMTALKVPRAEWLNSCSDKYDIRAARHTTRQGTSVSSYIASHQHPQTISLVKVLPRTNCIHQSVTLFKVYPPCIYLELRSTVNMSIMIENKLKFDDGTLPMLKNHGRDATLLSSRESLVRLSLAHNSKFNIQTSNITKVRLRS
ncbi:hypothetical protein Fmac_012270 [Flemingia macrophylla]|uniref:Uncharacterized protein n=1 Tax=Flemingia macrophylla TaxID=520843 RepID=A0ABD1MPV3_9FABA